MMLHAMLADLNLAVEQVSSRWWWGGGVSAGRLPACLPTGLGRLTAKEQAASQCLGYCPSVLRRLLPACMHLLPPPPHPPHPPRTDQAAHPGLHTFKRRLRRAADARDGRGILRRKRCGGRGRGRRHTAGTPMFASVKSTGFQQCMAPCSHTFPWLPAAVYCCYALLCHAACTACTAPVCRPGVPPQRAAGGQ